MNIISIQRYSEDYNNNNFNNQANDIAVLTTETDIIYTRGVGPACLPFLYANTFTENQVLFAAGWGSTEFGGPLSSVLLHVGLNVISQAQCSVRYPNVVDSQLCTFTPGKDACQVDILKHSLQLNYIHTRYSMTRVVDFTSGPHDPLWQASSAMARVVPRMHLHRWIRELRVSWNGYRQIHRVHNIVV